MSPLVEKMSRETPPQPGDPHLPCIILINTSSSMCGYEKQLIEGLRIIKESIKNDDIARNRIEVCVITFNDVIYEESSFSHISEMRVPELKCGGKACTHNAVEYAIQRIRERIKEYREICMSYYRPAIFLLTDGMSCDADNGIYEELRDMQMNHKCTFFGIAVGDDFNRKELAYMHKDGMYIELDKNADVLASLFVFIGDTAIAASMNYPLTKMAVPEGINIGFAP